MGEEATPIFSRSAACASCSRSGGEQHTLHVVAGGAGGTTLGFCGRHTERPYIEGTLEVSAEGALLGASWAFHTPHYDEHAGGHMEFVPVGPEGGPALLTPARSVFWRRLGGSRDWYFQDAAVYRAWAYGTTDSIPKLTGQP